MFQCMPGKAREIVSCFPLDALLGLLRVAVDELESEQPNGESGQPRESEPSDGIEYRWLHEFGESHLYPPLFVVAPQTSFADAWEVFCCDVINRYEKTAEINRRKLPESGVDLYWRSRQTAYQCKSVEGSTGKFNISKAVASLRSAMEIRETLPWKKYVLCSNVTLTGAQEEQLRAILLDIELLTPSFWLPRCREQSEHLGGRFRRLEPMGARDYCAGD